MEKAVAKAITKIHRKEREENKAKKIITHFNANEWASQHVVTRSARAEFEYN